jgi:hypothetical protein
MKMRRGIQANKKSRRDLYLEKMHPDTGEDGGGDMDIHLWYMFMIVRILLCKHNQRKTKLFQL